MKKLLVASGVFAISLLVSSISFAAGAPISTSSSAGLGTNISGVGTKQWSSVSNIISSNDSYTDVFLGNNEASNYLKASNFGFNIPSGATINGIQVSVERKRASTAGIQFKDNVVKLVTNLTGSNATSTDQSSATPWPTTDTSATYGTVSNTWGVTWTPEQINDPSFGLLLSVKRTDTSTTTSHAYVDYISITVTYVATSTGSPVAPTITIFNPSTTTALSKTITATSTGTLLQYISTSTVCDNTVNPGSFSSYTETTFTSDADNGKYVCYKATGTGTTFSRSNEILGIDTTGPVLTLPSNMVVEATNSLGAIVNYITSAFDTVDGVISTSSISCIPASGSSFDLDLTTQVNCSVADNLGNTSNGSFDVSVQDTTAPVISPISDFSTGATSSTSTIVTFSASATDLVDGNVSVSCSPASGSPFYIGTTTVNCEATDLHLNTGTSSFNVIVSDAGAPTLVLPYPNFTAEATATSGAIVDFSGSVSASDDVDGARTVTCTPASGLFPFGTTTVNCSASDTTGHIATSSFDVFVQDTTAPVITILGENPVTFSLRLSYDDAGATAHDNIDGDMSSSSITSVSTVNSKVVGTYYVTYTATDSHGNSSSSTRTVIVTKAARRHIAIDPSISTEESSQTNEVSEPTTEPEKLTVTEPVITEPAPQIGEVLGAQKFFFAKSLKFGLRGQEIKELQDRLKAEGFFKVESTGYFGNITREAVKAYQKAHGIDQVGEIGPKTRSELNK